MSLASLDTGVEVEAVRALVLGVVGGVLAAQVASHERAYHQNPQVRPRRQELEAHSQSLAMPPASSLSPTAAGVSSKMTRTSTDVAGDHAARS